MQDVPKNTWIVFDYLPGVDTRYVIAFYVSPSTSETIPNYLFFSLLVL